MSSLIRLVELHKAFGLGEKREEVIRGVNLEVAASDFLILFGPSGSGKSTLLNLITGLENPTSGTVFIDGTPLGSLSEDERAALRLATFGVVYQQPLWLKSLSVRENVALPLLIRGETEAKAFARAGKALTEAGMDRFASKRPTELSGGQQQRVSLARALVSSPKALILDEPTGSLDTSAADQVFSLVQDLQKRGLCAVIMVTHNPLYLPFASRIVQVLDGKTSDGEHLRHTS